MSDAENPPLTWFFAILAVLIIFGPVVWALTRGRQSGVPEHEDPRGDVGWAMLIRRNLVGWWPWR